jgi:hypothetical protein
MEPSSERLANLATCVLFAAALALPPLRTLVDAGRADTRGENRRAAALPTLPRDRRALAEFPARFERFYADAFGFRRTLLRWNSIVRTRWLGVSPSERVAIGQDGWLYYAGGGALEDDEGLRPFGPEELDGWQRALEARREWLAAHGIHHLVVIAPNTQSVYPEYLPRAHGDVGRPSRLDQLMERVRAGSPLDVIDLRETLRQARTRERVYQRTDSHWNDRGAFAAYQRIMQRVSGWYPAATPFARDAFEDIVEEGPGGDLARMIGLVDAYREEELALRPRLPRRARRAETGFLRSHLDGPGRPRAFEVDDSTLPRAVMLHDSFGRALIPFLSEHFRRILYLPGHDLAPRVIEREGPDLVIEELVERRLLEAPTPLSAGAPPAAPRQ